MDTGYLLPPPHLSPPPHRPSPSQNFTVITYTFTHDPLTLDITNTEWPTPTVMSLSPDNQPQPCPTDPNSRVTTNPDPSLTTTTPDPSVPTITTTEPPHNQTVSDTPWEDISHPGHTLPTEPYVVRNHMLTPVEYLPHLRGNRQGALTRDQGVATGAHTDIDTNIDTDIDTGCENQEQDSDTPRGGGYLPLQDCCRAGWGWDAWYKSPEVRISGRDFQTGESDVHLLIHYIILS